MDELNKNLHHANKLTSTLKLDRDSLQAELDILKRDIIETKILKSRAETAEMQLAQSRKEIEELNKKIKSITCAIS